MGLLVTRSLSHAMLSVETTLHPAGTLLRLSSATASVLARAVESMTGDPRSAGIDSEQMAALSVSPGEEVLVEEATAPTAARVFLRPLFGWYSDRMFSRVGAALVEGEAALSAGSRFRSPIGAGGATGVLEVVAVFGSDGEIAAGTVSSDTRIEVARPDSQDATGPDTPRLGDVAGMHSALEMLTEAVTGPVLRPDLYRRMGVTPPRGILLYGPPGSGKTFLARAVAAELDLHVEAVSGPELVGASHGQTESNLRRLFMHAADHSPAIVLLDEIDALAPRREHASSQADYRVVTQLLVLMDGLQQLDGVVVIATTNKPDAIDSALRRPGRFDVEVGVRSPSADERGEILSYYFARMPLSAEAAAAVPDLARETFGYLPADLMALTRAAGMRAIRRHVAAGEAAAGQEPVVAVADLEWARGSVRPSLLRGFRVSPPARSTEAAVSDRDWGSVLGEAGQGDSRGAPVRLLLVGGQPAAQREATDSVTRWMGAHVIHTSPADLFTAWFGESEDAVRTLFEVADDVAPTVVLLRHLDGIAPDRRTTSSAAGRRVLDQLLHELDVGRAGVHVVATTDDLTMVDPAILEHFDIVSVGEGADVSVQG
jgi:transitional endoplasmic reticulum ATPase